MTRSLDEESVQIKPLSKKKFTQIAIKDQKDPDYSAPYVPRTPKEPPTQKIQNISGIPGGEQFMQCYLILKKLKKSIYHWPFKLPVDPKALKIPEYVNVVQQPMDLKTVEENLKKQAYKHPAEFHRDIYKMLMNSYKFNQKNSQVFATTMEFEEEYLKIYKDAREGKLKPLQKKLNHEDIIFSEPILPEGQTSMEVEKQLQRKYKMKKIDRVDKIDKFENVEKLEKPEKLQKSEKQPKLEKVEKVEKPEKYEIPDRSELQKADKNLQLDKPSKVSQGKFPAKHVVVQKQQVKIQSKYPVSLFVLKQEQIKNNSIDHFFNTTVNQYKKQEIEPEKPEVKPVFVKQEAKESNDDPEYSLDNNYLKKTKSKIMNEKKHKTKKENTKKLDLFESPNEMEKFKENTQAENQKTMMYNNIQKKLTDMLKRLSQYQIPSKGKGQKQTQRNTEKHEHPNFTNFTTVTAAEKKKLGQKIATLSEQDHRYVIEICFRNKRLKSRDDEGVYDIDLDKLDGKVLKELSNFVGMRYKKTKKETLKSKEESKVSEKDVVEEDNNEHLDFEDEGEGEEEQDQDRISQDPDDFHPRSASYPDLIEQEVHAFSSPFNNEHDMNMNLELINFQDEDDPPNDEIDFPF